MAIFNKFIALHAGDESGPVHQRHRLFGKAARRKHEPGQLFALLI